jgi:uncharacterized cupin superfamily protein
MSAEPNAVTFAAIDRAGGERFQSLRRALGIRSFGMNAIALAPGQRGRIHAHREQEEVYLVLAGELTLVVEAVEHVVGPDGVARVPPAIRRQLVNAGDEPLVLVALGGAGDHAGRDGLAWEAWDEAGPGRSPQDVPLPDDLPRA